MESLIKAGAFDCFGVTRKQMMTVYIRMMEEQAAAAKNNMAGQLSLFDIVPEETRREFRVQYPDVGEYDRQMKLSFEKEVLGIYVSGHPMEDYEGLWRAHATAAASDFLLDEETGVSKAADNQDVTVGGMITEVKLKYTKNNQVMSFVTLEDLTGSMEVIVFPKAYEAYSELLREDSKVFVQGRVSQEEARDSKLLARTVTPFEAVPRELWIRFQDMADYRERESELMSIVNENGGRDQVVIYIQSPRAMKRLPAGQGIQAGDQVVRILKERFGTQNVTVR